MKTKHKSTILFILIVLLIAFLGYTGAFGLKIGDYEILSFNDTIKRGLDLQGGVSVTEKIEGKHDQSSLNRTVELLSMRVNQLGVSETVVTPEGNDKIRIDVPGKFDTKEVIESVAKTGKLTFVGPDKKVILTGSDVKDAVANLDQQNNPVIDLQFKPEGTKKFKDATTKFLNQEIDIYMDNELVTNPKVEVVISDGKAQITGSKTMEEAQRKAQIIKSGALPVTLKTESAQVVGASLGANALPQSILAGEVGIGIVLVFMLLYYRIPGIIADIALCLYIVLVLGAYSIIGATLTLSGIAGLLLTIGMAVDANVLIFERMKEELKSGKSIKSSIDAGFHRAMSSILDSNITTIIAGVVLYYLGSGSVKGFALTLVIGTILSMFTAITVTRTLIKLAANMGWFKEKWTIGTFGVHDVRKGVN